MAIKTCNVSGCLKNKQYGKYCIRHINGDVLSENYSDFFRECLYHGYHRQEIKVLLIDIYTKKDSFKELNNLDSFEKVYIFVNDNYRSKPRAGPLFIYDVTTQLCRYYSIPIDKVYIVGSGPRINCNKLNLTLKYNPDISLQYVVVQELIDKLSIDYINKVFGELSNDFIGDDLETILCGYK